MYYYRQQPETFGFPGGGGFPGFPGGGGSGNLERRLNQLERQVNQNTREINRLDRRLDRLERRLGIGRDQY